MRDAARSECTIQNQRARLEQPRDAAHAVSVALT